MENDLEMYHFHFIFTSIRRFVLLTYILLFVPCIALLECKSSYFKLIYFNLIFIQLVIYLCMILVSYYYQILI
jgi:hypothetical protein